MKKILALGIVALGLFGCTQASSVASGVTPTTVCQAVATLQANQAASAQLAAIPLTSALGDVWAKFQSGCVNGAPAAGVSTSWTAMLGGMFKALLPVVLPTVAQYALPLLIGLL